MSWVAELILAIEGLVFVGILILVVILGIRAYNKKQEETFEDRDN